MMPIKQLDKEQFIYLVYKRISQEDFIEFKKVVLARIKDTQNRDIVIDLTPNSSISNGEVGLLVEVGMQFEGTSTRKLRLIADNEVADKLKTVTMLKIRSVIIYESHESFFSEINRAESTIGEV